MEKILKGKRFANVEEVEQKRAETLKGIKIYEFRNCFEQYKKHFDRCMASNGEYSEGDLKFKHLRINTQFFIKLLVFWGRLLSYSGCLSIAQE